MIGVRKLLVEGTKDAPTQGGCSKQLASRNPVEYAGPCWICDPSSCYADIPTDFDDSMIELGVHSDSGPC
jgi:hypothetical protein